MENFKVYIIVTGLRNSANYMEIINNNKNIDGIKQIWELSITTFIHQSDSNCHAIAIFYWTDFAMSTQVINRN